VVVLTVGDYATGWTFGTGTTWRVQQHSLLLKDRFADGRLCKLDRGVMITHIRVSES